MATTAEFEELRLSVVLVDDASRGLTALRGEMRNFNDDATRFIKTARDNAQAVKRVADETSEAVKSIRAAGEFFKTAGGVIGIVSGAYVGTILWLQKFALETEQIANAAQLVGVTYADLRNVAAQLARSGLSPDMAGPILGALNDLGLQLQSWGGIRDWESKFEASKIALDPVQAQAYVRAMINARGWHERWTIVRNAADSIERKGLAANRDKAEVAAEVEEFFVTQGFPKEAALQRSLAATTEAQKEKYGRITDGAKRWNEITHKITKSFKTILEILNADSMDPDGPFYTMLKLGVNITGYIDKNLASWIASITDAGIWLADKFTSSPEGAEKPGGGTMDTEGLMPPVEPMGFVDDTPAKMEKLIREFRAFHDNLRSGTPAGPAAPLEQHASLGSMATPGLQLPPAAMAGDIYTDKYGIWPGGGAKPAGSDVGPGSGAGPMSGFGGFGGHPIDRPVEGSFRGGVPRLRTPGGIYIGRRWEGAAGGAADGDEPSGGKDLPKLPGDFRMPGGTGPLGSYKNVVAQPDYLAGTEPSTNIQDVRSGSWGGAGGAGGTSQPPHLASPGAFDKEKSVFVPGLDRPAPFYPPSTTNPMETSIEELADQPFRLKRERQSFEPGSMRDLIQKSPGLYRRGAEQTRDAIELRREREAAELNEPLAFPWRAPGGPRTGPGDLGPSGIPTDRGQFGLDRSVIDRGMGNEMSGKLEGGIGLNVNVKGPAGIEATAEGSGIINKTEVNREASFGAD